MKKQFSNSIQMLGYIYEASKFRIFFAVINAILQSVNPVLIIIIIQQSITMLMSGDENSLYSLGFFLLICVAINAVIIIYGGWYRLIYGVHSDFKIKKSIQQKVYLKIQSIDISAFDDPQFYSVYTRAVNETSSRAINVLSTFTNLLRSILTFIGVIYILISLDAVIIAFVVISIVLSILLNGFQNKISYKYDREQTKNIREQEYVGRLFYLSQYAKDIKFFNLYGYFTDKFRHSIDNQDTVRKKYDKKLTLVDILQNAVQVLTVLTTIFYLGWKFVIGSIVIADFATLLNASQELGGTIQQIFMFLPQTANNSMYIDDLNEFLNYKSTIEKDGGITPLPGRHVIEAKKLQFRYSSASPLVLDKIDLCINPGEKIAIVGRNGSGKTTLIKILLRLYDPTSGIVEMDGKDYREYDVRSLRRRIGVVFQDFSCYASSVADNVLLRSVQSEKDEQTVVNSLKLCGLYEKVSALKNGIYTVLTKEFDEDGVIFSGGEMQKLAIARMFANDYDIIIMDEPSSALDPIAEYELNSKIIEAAANKTLIIVSHRLSTTKDADKIIYMENGRIEEMGTHKSLIELNGKYAELFNIQASKYYG